jgi:hypothetical protein
MEGAGIIRNSYPNLIDSGYRIEPRGVSNIIIDTNLCIYSNIKRAGDILDLKKI